MEFTLLQEAKILYGAGKVQETGALMRCLGVDKVLVVCDEGVKKAGIVERVTNSLTQAQVKFVLFDKVQADPPSEVVDKGAAFCKAEQCGAVIAVGGGSSIDTAKGINLLRCNPGKIMDYAGPKGEMKKAGGLVAIPTTAGTGSELSDGLIITSPEHVKCPILATNAMAEYIILDPLLTVGLPAGLTASTGMDVLAHSVESYTSTAASVPTDQISEGNIRSVIQWLPLAVSHPDALKPREHMAVASMLGGWMLRYGHTHAGHSVAHVLGARCSIPHGYACAYALPWVLEFNAPVLLEKTVAVGKMFGCSFTGDETPQQIGMVVRQAVTSFRDEMLQLRPVSSFVERPDNGMLDRMAAEIEVDLFQAFNPRRMNKEDARIILENIFS
ncbi:iron-containing alcohol dehydrogenase [Ruthenibacterium sp. CLA-JM-H11]|uniref:Iron-containing alcohol dehydrogenase n=1 Tax=Ruthenibacterium intestinale TaxID=3133163 RepID=A0ABV1GIT7_9FIRM